MLSGEGLGFWPRVRQAFPRVALRFFFLLTGKNEKDRFLAFPHVNGKPQRKGGALDWRGFLRECVNLQVRKSMMV